MDRLSNNQRTNDNHVHLGATYLALAKGMNGNGKDWTMAPYTEDTQSLSPIDTNQQNLLLLVYLRWIAVAGQIATILCVNFLIGIPLPLTEMFSVVTFLALLNLISLYHHHRGHAVTPAILFLQLLLDVASLTLQLYLSGGALNPFVSLYLLQVILCAVLLDVRASWALIVITSGCFIFLTGYYRDEAIVQHLQAQDRFGLHLQGMFICFVLAAGLLVLFVTRINQNVRERDARLAQMHQRSIEEGHILRLGLLASGAAHELGTPLATLSVILGDWEKMPLVRNNADMHMEIREMQTQLARCKETLSAMLLSSGQARGEGAEVTTVVKFLDQTIDEWREWRSPIHLEYRNDFKPDRPIVSDLVLKQMLSNVLDNAIEASPDFVSVTVSNTNDHIVIRVDDAGPGFDESIVKEFGAPYQSSKEQPGRGLGLFLVVNVLRTIGGTVRAFNQPSGGATVELSLPLSALSIDKQDRSTQ